MLGKVIQKILALHAELPLFKEKKVLIISVSDDQKCME